MHYFKQLFVGQLPEDFERLDTKPVVSIMILPRLAETDKAETLPYFTGDRKVADRKTLDELIAFLVVINGSPLLSIV